MKKISFLLVTCLIVSSTQKAEFDGSLFDVFKTLSTEKKLFLCLTHFLVPLTVLTVDYMKESLEKKEMQNINLYNRFYKYYGYDNLHLWSLNSLILLATWGGCMTPFVYLRQKSLTL